MEQILTYLFGGTSLIGLITTFAFWSANRRLKSAEAKKAETDADSAEVARLLTQLDHQQETITKLTNLTDSLTARLSTLNATVDKHIDRNRELSDRQWRSEQEVNKLNETIITLTEERDQERLEKERYKNWHCRKGDCTERLPPNPKLMGLTFVEP